MIPPGHYYDGTTVTKCSSNPGSYQPDWVAFSNAATSCIACGAGIPSEYNQPLNTYTGAYDGSGSTAATFVALSSDSCCEWIGASGGLARGLPEHVNCLNHAPTKTHHYSVYVQIPCH
jgi:hypothetical protein